MLVPDPALVCPSPAAGFAAAAVARPQHPALEIGSQRWSYAELSAEAGRLRAAIERFGSERPLVAVFASRSLAAHAGTLAVFFAGRAHVALNPSHPAERNAAILDQAGADTVVVDRAALAALPALIALHAGALTVLAPDVGAAELAGPRAAWPEVRWVGAEAIAALTPRLEVPETRAGDLAYLVFTSGSTGTPKGVAITHGNLAHYMRSFRELAAPLPRDRVAATYELTFDVALHDMLNTWWSGATLCVVPARQLLAPARFIVNERVTYWFSVASSAMLAEQQGTLLPGAFPLLRVSMLCGEPLPVGTAAAWAAAAPASELYNVYGPTETTMELAFYRWRVGASEAECRRGVVPIGLPFAGHAHLLFDPDGGEVEGEGRGELLLSGPQVGPGYWLDTERTARTFVELPGRKGTWYRTGDLVERDAAGLYHFVGRLDHQVKLRGYRLELGEVEAAVRRLAGSNLVAVVPHPVVGGNAQGLVAFVAGSRLDAQALRRGLPELLPLAMVPDRIVLLDALPLNGNRKIDRGALLDQLGV
jgi:amino acid adenylation domain-containing protein